MMTEGLVKAAVMIVVLMVVLWLVVSVVAVIVVLEALQFAVAAYSSAVISPRPTQYLFHLDLKPDLFAAFAVLVEQ